MGSGSSVERTVSSEEDINSAIKSQQNGIRFNLNNIDASQLRKMTDEERSSDILNGHTVNRKGFMVIIPNQNLLIN